MHFVFLSRVSDTSTEVQVFRDQIADKFSVTVLALSEVMTILPL